MIVVGIEHRGGDDQMAIVPPHTAFQREVHVVIPANGMQVVGFAAIHPGGRLRHDRRERSFEAGNRIRHIAGEVDRQRILRRIAAAVGERQDDQRLAPILR